MWVERSNSIRMTDVRSPSSATPSFIALIYTTMEMGVRSIDVGGFRKGKILPVVFYSNSLMLLSPGFL